MFYVNFPGTTFAFSPLLGAGVFAIGTEQGGVLKCSLPTGATLSEMAEGSKGV